MNIQLLIPNFLSKRCNTNYNSNLNNSSYPNLRPLEKDTVSFTGKKILTNYTNEITFDVACQVEHESQKALKELLRILRKELKKLIESPAQPNKQIVAGANGIKGRVKSARSIQEKVEALNKEEGIKITTKAGIEKMGDVVGARIIMRTSTQKDYDNLFTELGKMVKRGELKIKSVENYRLTSNDSYVSANTLEKFEQSCNEAGIYPEIKNQAIPNGYTAVHVNVELPDGRYAEIQIMGRDMENVKEIEDFYYKYRCNKKFAPRYKEIQQIFDEEMPNLTDLQKETLRMYILDSYKNAKELPARETKRSLNLSRDFLPFPYSLPQRLSYENLFRMKDECDRAAKRKFKSQ